MDATSREDSPVLRRVQDPELENRAKAPFRRGRGEDAKGEGVNDYSFQSASDPAVTCGFCGRYLGTNSQHDQCTSCDLGRAFAVREALDRAEQDRLDAEINDCERKRILNSDLLM